MVNPSNPIFSHEYFDYQHLSYLHKISKYFRMGTNTNIDMADFIDDCADVTTQLSLYAIARALRNEQILIIYAEDDTNTRRLKHSLIRNIAIRSVYINENYLRFELSYVKNVEQVENFIILVDDITSKLILVNPAYPIPTQNISDFGLNSYSLQGNLVFEVRKGWKISANSITKRARIGRHKIIADKYFVYQPNGGSVLVNAAENGDTINFVFEHPEHKTAYFTFSFDKQILLLRTVPVYYFLMPNCNDDGIKLFWRILNTPISQRKEDIMSFKDFFVTG